MLKIDYFYSCWFLTVLTSRPRGPGGLSPPTPRFIGPTVQFGGPSVQFKIKIVILEPLFFILSKKCPASLHYV